MDAADLEKFADNLKAKFALTGTASPEDQLKPDVAALLVAAGAKRGLKVETRTETHLSEHKVRPDIAIYVGGLICGYVELKAPGLGADAPKLKGDHNKKQWAKLKVSLRRRPSDGISTAMISPTLCPTISSDPRSRSFLPRMSRVGDTGAMPTRSGSWRRAFWGIVRWRRQRGDMECHVLC